MILGAGRATKESIIDLSVGIVLHKKIGDKVEKGQPLVTIHSNSESIDAVTKLIYDSYEITQDYLENYQLIYDQIQE